ncbi:hypothetical protein [Synechococcus sp. 1G10]|uniref:hypothetical protein n=1 Tax=Synechococcus sp. 1G10 TaxID=2025605 RepID=UPI000B997597|nr:hypothetical protein [Synechococcus sp. 1G10]
MSGVLPSLAWGSAQAGGALTVASTGWLVSGLSPSPLVNSLLPALGALPALLPLPLKAREGYGLQLAGALLLLAVSVRLTGPSVFWPLLAVLLFGLGGRMSHLPLQQILLSRSRVAMEQQRQGRSLGQLLGTLLTGALFPIGKAVAQYASALVLLLPLLPLAWASAPVPVPVRKGGFELRSLLQGVLFGSLFALLALWVRKVGAGNCFDFGMVLTAYGLGRALGATPLQPRLVPGLPYLLIALVLAATQALPGWGAVLLFLPMGLLAAASDGHLIDALAPSGDLAVRWQVLERSGVLGGLLGTLSIGALSQVLGLERALPIVLAAFVLAGLLMHRRWSLQQA